jgi:hypothetical protein
MAVGSLPPDMFRELRNSVQATPESEALLCFPEFLIRFCAKTKCRMSILAIRHPALQSMCSKD